MVFSVETGIYDDDITFLETLADVNISNPTDGQAVVYNATTKKYENGNVVSGYVDAPLFGDVVVATGANSVVSSNKMNVSFAGAVGFNGQYGAIGEVLTSQGLGGSPIWVSPEYHIVAGSSINAGIYNYINFKDIVNSPSNYTRYDFFRVPRISSLYTVRLMKLKIQTEYFNESAHYQENIVRWNDSTGEITGVQITQIEGISSLPVSTLGAPPALNATNSGKIWVWEDNTNVYVSFINILNRNHRMLIHMELFNVRHADGGVAYIL